MIPQNIGRYVNTAIRLPRIGDPYCRCPECKEQVFAQVARSATFGQKIFTLRANLARHIKNRHGDVNGS